MHEVLVNRLGGLSLPRKSVVRLTDHPDMTLDVYRGRKTTVQQQQQQQFKNNITELSLTTVCVQNQCWAWAGCVTCILGVRICWSVASHPPHKSIKNSEIKMNKIELKIFCLFSILYPKQTHPF